MYAFHKKQIGDVVKLKVLRDNKIMELDYTLKRVKPIVNTEYNVEPRYYIFGGLVFTPLTHNLLKTFSLPKGSMDLLFYNEVHRMQLEEPVICMRTTFPHKVNRGYTPTSEIIYSVNGIRIKNLKHLVQLLEHSNSEFTVIEFFEKDNKIILKTTEARNSFNEIKKHYDLSAKQRL